MYKSLFIFAISITFLFHISSVFAQSNPVIVAQPNPVTTECSSISVNIKTGTPDGQIGPFPTADNPFIVKVQWGGINPGTQYKIVVKPQTGTASSTSTPSSGTAGELTTGFAGVPPGDYHLTLSFIDPKDSKEFFICQSGLITVARVTAGPPTAPKPAPVTDPCKTDKKSCTSGGGQRCNTADGTLNTPGGDGIMTAIGCIPTQPQKLVEGLLKYGTLAAGGVAFLLMILAALQMITAEGNPDTIKQSQEKFYSAIIGLLLIIFSVLLMQVIGVDLLGLKGFGR